MNDNPKEEFSGLTLIQDDGNDLTCDAYEEFCEALAILYLQRNLSGRLNFCEAWPVAAAHIFGEELIQNDNEGTKDFERRAVLEEEAEERRLALLDMAETIHEKSVHRGALQVEYVEESVKGIGRDLALLLYSEKIVNRFLPLSVDDVSSVPILSEAGEVNVSSAVSQNPVSNIPDDIDVESLGLGQSNDDMAVLNQVGGPLKDEEDRPKPSGVVFSPVEDPKAAPLDNTVSEQPKKGFDEIEDELDAIQPISVGNEVPPDATILPQDPEAKANEPPMSPEESEYFRPNQWANEGAMDVESGEPVGEIKNDAMSGMTVSQKMTFVPSKKEDEEKAAPKSGIIPVIGSSAQKPQDEE